MVASKVRIFLPRGDGDNPEHEVDGGPDGEDDVPDPQEDVDLLVDDVEGKDAEAIVQLNRA